MARVFGYVRVSTVDQLLDLQCDAMAVAGIEPKNVFQDSMSGARGDRPGLTDLIGRLAAEDTVVVWRLDRLGRSMMHLAELLAQFQRNGVRFKSLTEGVDTGTAAGRMIFGVLSSLAEYERESIVERVRAGLEASRKRGTRLGRPKGLTVSQRDHAADLQRNGMSYAAIGDLMGVSASTVFRNLGSRPFPLGGALAPST